MATKKDSMSLILKQLPQAAEVSLYQIFLDGITTDEVIDLSHLEFFSAGGTHKLYKLKSEGTPSFLLKVMFRTRGGERDQLKKECQMTNSQYHGLYQAFGDKNCMFEYRQVAAVQDSATSQPERVIVSVVRYEPCFKSQTRMGLNVPVYEFNELLSKHKAAFKRLMLALVGPSTESARFNTDDLLALYPGVNNLIKPIIAKDASFIAMMKAFLLAYQRFYKKTGILLDIIGFDNVLFYKDAASKWQFKIGSVIKHDSRDNTREWLDAICANPQAANTSFVAQTSVYYMPSCIVVINALARLTGLESIIGDIILDEAAVDKLIQSHQHFPLEWRIGQAVRTGDFELAFELYGYMEKTLSEQASQDYSLKQFISLSYYQYLQDGHKPTEALCLDCLKLLKSIPSEVMREESQNRQKAFEFFEEAIALLKQESTQVPVTSLDL